MSSSLNFKEHLVKSFFILLVMILIVFGHVIDQENTTQTEAGPTIDIQVFCGMYGIPQVKVEFAGNHQPMWEEWEAPNGLKGIVGYYGESALGSTQGSGATGTLYDPQIIFKFDPGVTYIVRFYQAEPREVELHTLGKLMFVRQITIPDCGTEQVMN
jgi:hypothetical protein